MKKSNPKANDYEDLPIIPPPASMTVDDRKPTVILYKADGTPLIRKVGF